MIGLKFAGRPPIRIAESVKDIVHLKDPYAEAIMDRRVPIDDGLVGAIIGQSVMSWEGRNPRPALDENGNFQATDLDLFSFLMPLAARRAVIEIPQYRNRRKVVVKANERKIGTSQFGPIIGLTSDKDVFSFSVLIRDKTIVKRDPVSGREKIGAPRNYMLVDCDGHWYYGLDRIVFDPTAKENTFLTEKGLWAGNTVYFKYYVHPNRWQSVFSAHYLLGKMTIARIDDEAGFYRQEIKRLKGIGITFPRSAKAAYPSYVLPDYQGPTEPIQVGTMEMILDLPDLTGSYEAVPNTIAGLQIAYKKQKYLTYTLKPAIQFNVRANEAAYYRYGVEDATSGKIAHWLEGRYWTPGWKESPRARNKWNIMVLSPDVSLRWRTKTVTERVSAE